LGSIKGKIATTYKLVFGVVTRVGVNVSNIFGVGARKGILKHGAGAESESEKCDSAHLFEVCNCE